MIRLQVGNFRKYKSVQAQLRLKSIFSKMGSQIESQAEAYRNVKQKNIALEKKVLDCELMLSTCHIELQNARQQNILLEKQLSERAPFRMQSQTKSQAKLQAKMQTWASMQARPTDHSNLGPNVSRETIIGTLSIMVGTSFFLLFCAVMH